MLSSNFSQSRFNPRDRVGGAMTDVKGDRSLAPHLQEDKDMFVHIVNRSEKGVYVSGR